MARLTDLGKRIVLGRAMRSDRLGETLLPKRLALPVFASDALSSNAYATEEILLVLSLGGLSLLHFAPWVAAAVVLIFFTVVASYRQNVHAYPSGGGDYEVATENLGASAGLVVASALLVDYVLTVAVSISAAVDNISSSVEAADEHSVLIAVLLIGVITFMNLRGVRESGTAFAVPVYGFMIGIFTMILYASFQLARGTDLRAESADWTIVPESQYAGLALVFLLLRSFSSGTTALTGIEAISNGVPAFRKPKSRNAATTLALLGLISMTMFSSITWLAVQTDVKKTEFDRDLIGLPPGDEQKTVMVQVAEAVFHNFSPGAFYVALTTALILVLAANTAFNGFPVLGSILARDGYLPRQLHTRGDRLAFSNGIVALAAVAILLVYAFDAQVTRLIQLYIVGVFVSFTLSQTGMVRHWTRLLVDERDPVARARMMRSRVVNAFGLAMTGTVLVIVLVTKFLRGAWIAILAMGLLFLMMRGIRRHYDRVRDELAVGDVAPTTLPSRVHAIVLVSKIHQPTLRALAYARATRPSTLEAVTVAVDLEDARSLQEEWEARALPVPLKVLESPFREITRPVVEYIQGLRRDSPRDLVTVFVPEYVVGKWWEQLLHNQSALRLRTRLRFTTGVVVTSVPYLLASGRGEAEHPSSDDDALITMMRGGAIDDEPAGT